MELYSAVSYEIAQKITTRYSTSFSMSSRLFSAKTRPHIYAIYGMVRIADEIVDTFRTDEAAQQLSQLEDEVMRAVRTGYSSNPVIHAFAQTARKYAITEALIAPFFESMQTDLTKKTFTAGEYERYIYGSAEVIGLMCLQVFMRGNEQKIQSLTQGARSLGAAYQKVNFLRDFASDYDELGRVYFPGVTYETFSAENKASIIADIKIDFSRAEVAINGLPAEARRAVRASFYYYTALLHKLERTSVITLKEKRIRLSNAYKLLLLVRAVVHV